MRQGATYPSVRWTVHPDAIPFLLGWLYIFAGFDGTERLNDMWRIKLTSSEPAWEPVEQRGDVPPPLCNCPVTLAGSQLYLFSGIAGTAAIR